MAELLLRSPYLAFCWRGPDFVVVEGLSGRQYRMSALPLGVLLAADKPMTRNDLVQASRCGLEIVDALAIRSLLVEPGSIDKNESALWSPHELAVRHTRPVARGDPIDAEATYSRGMSLARRRPKPSTSRSRSSFLIGIDIQRHHKPTHIQSTFLNV